MARCKGPLVLDFTYAYFLRANIPFEDSSGGFASHLVDFINISCDDVANIST